MKKFIIVSLILHAVVLLRLGNNLIQQSTYAVSQGLGTIYMEVVPEASIAQASAEIKKEILTKKIQKSEFAKVKKSSDLKKIVREQIVKKKIVRKVVQKERTKEDVKSYENAVNNHARLARASMASYNATVKASPDYLKNPPPAYPRKSRLNKEQGTVLLLVDISEKGEALKLILKNSSGHSRLDRSALESVRSWKFKPARISGLAIESTVLVPVRYVLN